MNLEDFADNKELVLHVEAIEFYFSRLKRQSLCKAAVIVGSFAKGCADRLSDIDLVVFVEERNLLKVYQNMIEEEPFGLVHAFEVSQEPQFCCKKYIFDNYVSAEIYVVADTAHFSLKQPFLVLLDRDDFLQSCVEEGEPPLHEEFPALSLGEKGLGWELHDMVKWWARGERELVKSHIKKVARKLEDWGDEDDGKS